MAASLFKITPTPPTVLALEPGEEGKFSFTVESLAAPGRVHEIILQALRVGPDGKGEEVDWLVVGPHRTQIVSGGKTETVTITARPDAGTPRGPHRIKLVIADRDRPNDVYADSSPVSLDVKIPVEEQASPPPRTLWWLIAAIAGGVLLVGGGVLVFVLAGDDEPELARLGEACRGTDGKECAEGLVCTGGRDAGICLRAGGAACTPAGAGLCASGECVSGRQVCAIQAGGECDPVDQAITPAVPCARNLVCNARTRTCLSRLIRPDLPLGTLNTER
jgi:hypothetical protein